MGRTVILAAGDFPRRTGAAYGILTDAARVICCDSAADAYRRRFGRDPDCTVGDLDSVKVKSGEVVQDDDQDTNDLAKAVAYCRRMKYRDLVILGATGKREDHTIGNIYRALEFGIEVVTDHGRFLPVNGKRVLRVKKGAAVSIFASDPKTRVVSTGLEWPLEGVSLDSPWRATLNRASEPRISLSTTAPIFVYVAGDGFIK